jgi:hypothetical protein
LEEARAVFAKHGFAVPEPVAKNSKSRTSSEMLFGESSANDKKREAKALHKEDDMISMTSKKSSLTVGSRLSNRSFLKEVIEENWKATGEIDKKSNKYYQCKLCLKERVR